jgi:type VI secretion system protein ImpA
MSVRWEGEELLLQPITPERPCGENLEDTELLASFDAYRLFGQSRPLDAQPDPNDRNDKWVSKPPESPEWAEIRDKANEALKKSKDLRLLANLGTALLRTDGVPGFAATLNVASQWLEMHWQDLYPLVDEDAILRRNALNCFADPMAVVDRLRRTALVRSRQHGTFSLRDIDGDRPGDEQQVSAAFGSVPIADLAQLHDSVATSMASLQKIDAKMRENAGSDATPAFEQLSAQLNKMGQALRAQLAAHPERSEAEPTTAEPAPGASQPTASLGAIKSRQDAIRALDAVSAFFRQTEPSSPVPLFIERAKRLVSKDFLEVLADVAPDALGQARAAGGLRDSQES